jgi:hypothetical protein
MFVLYYDESQLQPHYIMMVFLDCNDLSFLFINFLKLAIQVCVSINELLPWLFLVAV